MQSRLVGNNNNDSGYDFDKFKKQINTSYQQVLVIISETVRIDKLATTDSKSYLAELVKLLNKALFKDGSLKFRPNQIVMNAALLKIYALFKMELTFRSQLYRQMNIILKSNLIDDLKLLELHLCVTLGKSHLCNTQTKMVEQFENIIHKHLDFSVHFNGAVFAFPEIDEKTQIVQMHFKGVLLPCKDPESNSEDIKLHVNWQKCQSIIFAILANKKAFAFAPNDNSAFAAEGRKFVADFTRAIEAIDPLGKGEWLTLDKIHTITKKYYTIYPILISYLTSVIKREKFHSDYKQCLKQLRERILILEKFATDVAQDSTIPRKVVIAYNEYYKKFQDEFSEFWQAECPESLYLDPEHYLILKERYIKDLEMLHSLNGFLNKHQQHQQQLHVIEDVTRRKQEDAMRDKLKQETQAFIADQKMRTTLFKAKVAELKLKKECAKKIANEVIVNPTKDESKVASYINESVMLRIKNLNNTNMQTLIQLVTGTGSVKMHAAQTLFKALYSEAISHGSSHFTIILEKLIVTVPLGVDPSALSDSSKLSKGGMFFPHGSSHTSDLPWRDRELIQDALSDAGITTEILIKIGVLSEEKHKIVPSQ